jgi:hypothetical protein
LDSVNKQILTRSTHLKLKARQDVIDGSSNRSGMETLLKSTPFRAGVARELGIEMNKN